MEKKINQIKKAAFELNVDLVKHGLVTLTWGNASVVDRDLGVFAIKPSGVPYNKLKWQDMVLVDLSGSIMEFSLKPSSDTATHVEIYRGFNEVNAIIHTHSTWATIWAQAAKSIPALGTTHADHFSGEIPCLPYLDHKKVSEGYEQETGRQIVQFYRQNKICYFEVPACILAGHAPFVWGMNPSQAITNAVALERTAMMAYHSILINNKITFPVYILEKHFCRKHGKGATYGQGN